MLSLVQGRGVVVVAFKRRRSGLGSAFADLIRGGGR